MKPSLTGFAWLRPRRPRMNPSICGFVRRGLCPRRPNAFPSPTGCATGCALGAQDRNRLLLVAL
eukprot:2004876-Pyramimonas_sp.AAC.1